jgi:hypothetical protein
MKIRYLKPATLGETLSDALNDMAPSDTTSATSADQAEQHPPQPVGRPPHGPAARSAQHGHTAQHGK